VASFEDLLSWIEAVCKTLASILIVVIMLVVFSDVVCRYVFNSPLPWAYDVVNLYLMAGVFFLALSYSYAAHAHIGVDILLQRLSTRGLRIVECLTCVVAAPLFCLMALAGWDRAYENWINSDALSGPIPWPTWVGPALMAFGAGMLVLRLTLRLIGNVGSLLTNRDLIKPLPSTSHARVE
jgi:TRAP-type C4-dicarboxylate transport system permease small subunit